MKKKIGEILIAHKAVTAEGIAEALALQLDGDPSRLGEILIQRGQLGADALARALAEQKALPYTELNLVSSLFAKRVPLSFQHRHWLVPFEEVAPGEFCIAVADPTVTDAIEQVKNWLNAKSIQLYIASSDEIERVLSAIEDEQLASGEILVASEKESTQKQPALEKQSAQKPSALSEEELFDSLEFEDEPTAAGRVPLSSRGVAQQTLSTQGSFDETTQIARRPGPPSETQESALQTLPAEATQKTAKPKPSESDVREQTPRLGSSEILPSLSPFATQLAELLSQREASELTDVVIGLADLLVSKSILSREEILGIFISSPAEKG